MERACLALGAMAARGGPIALNGFAGQALQLTQDACTAGDMVTFLTAWLARSGPQWLCSICSRSREQL